MKKRSGTSGGSYGYSDMRRKRGIGKKICRWLNGKVERSHRTDAEECYQLLEYQGDVDVNNKLAEWENFYNFSRPHSSHGGKTPYEILREKSA